MTASDATGRLPAKHRAWRLGREVLVHLAIMAAVLGAAELILRAIDLRELRDSYEPGRALLFRHDAELGWAPVPNASATFTGTRTVTVRNNSLGLRNLEPGRAHKPTVIFVGDSFVWGYDVEANERFTELLRTELPAARIVNAGVPGYGTDQEYLLLARIWDAVFRDVHEDFELTTQRGPGAGTHLRRRAVQEYGEDYLATFDRMTFEPEEFRETDDQVVVLVTRRAR